ncbi:hypothetical protein BGX30_004664 [Mortierella sp. GBA39]|nr:hypothetical protein BGX30_004664 [Mortierella sp. GBA39]
MLSQRDQSSSLLLQQQQQQQQQQQRQQQGLHISNNHSQLSIPWGKHADIRPARRTSSSALSNTSTTDLEETFSDRDSSQDVSSSPPRSNQSSWTASSTGTAPSAAPSTAERKKSKTSGLKLSLKSLRTPKSQPQMAPQESTDGHGSHMMPDGTFGSSLEGWSSSDRPPMDRTLFHNGRRDSTQSTHQPFSTSAPKASSRLSFLHSPIPTSPLMRPSHQRSNTTPLQSPGPPSYATSPGRSITSPSPQPVKETHKMMKEYDPMTGNKMINKYMVVQELGRGVHGKVKLCRDTTTDELCAIKIVDKTTRRRLGRSQASNEQKIRREIAIMKKCIHPHVVRLIEVIDDPTARKIYLVIEYMEGGEVKWKDPNECPILPLGVARTIFRDIVLGLEYLHMQGIIHRDIKPANLLKSAEGSVKISDFGVSHFSEKTSLDRDLENSPIVSKGFHVPSTSHPDYSPRHSMPSSPIFSSFGKNYSASNSSQHLDASQSSQQKQSSAVAQYQQWGDDLELAKTAGSPAFFAPELCHASEFNSQSLSAMATASQTSVIGSSQIAASSLSNPFGPLPSSNGHPTGRPPITKAIDIWALGVTLYCFVFGRCPFIADTEFELFNIIPRKPLTFPEGIPGRETIDAGLMDLLSRLLEKDVYKRITLKEVKEHPWVTEDIADPVRWRIETDPMHYQRVHVTEDEVQGAVKIMDRIKNRIRKLSVSISNFTINRRRSKSISSTHAPDSPTMEQGGIPFSRSPIATPGHSGGHSQSQTQQVGGNPMSLPERFHHYHSYNGSGSGFGSGRLERPNSVCSNSSSIDEGDEGEEYGTSSGSLTQSSTYSGRRRIFGQQPSLQINPITHQQQHSHQQHQFQHHHHHHPLPPTPHQHQQHPLPPTQHQHQHQHHGGNQHRPPSILGYSSLVSHQASLGRRTYSDDAIDPHGQTSSSLLGTSIGNRSMTNVHSGLSKSWVFSPTEASPLSPEVLQIQAEGQRETEERERSKPVVHVHVGAEADEEGIMEEEEDASTPRSLARAVMLDRSLT